MSLRAKKPEVTKCRLKVFMYGNPKVGKSTLSVQFPKPYIIDTEGSMNKKKYVDLIKKSGGDVFETQDFEDLITEVKTLLSTKHDYKTLVIDSLSILYNDLLDKAAKSRISDKDPDGTAFGGHYGVANKRIKHLLNLLLRLDMNVVITSHAKNEYGQNMAILGQTFDCYKKLDYLFDLIFEVQRRGRDDRVVFVKGSRLEEFQEYDVFPASYNEISKRYDNETLERESVAERLASKEDISHLKYLIELYKEPEEMVQKWLDKAGASSFDELNENIIKKIIAHMESKAKPKGDKAA